MKIISLPLGYKREGKDIVVDEEYAKVVRFIFELYADGKSLYDVYYALKEEGYTSKRGVPFSASSISKVLDNEVYIGNYVYNKSKIVYVDGKKQRIRFDKSEWKVATDVFPAIIDTETYNKVREIKTLWKLQFEGGFNYYAQR